MRSIELGHAILTLATAVVCGIAMLSCQRVIVCEDWIMFEELELNNPYVVGGESAWQITALEIDEAKENCLFRIENVQRETEYTEWVKLGDDVGLGADESRSAVFLKAIAGEKVILGLRGGTVYEKYQLKG